MTKLTQKLMEKIVKNKK